eukprot:TRINITY_DN9691_c0_g1_i1.p1 TRINITY_DN9691_c0_g1~~TRINITY_DN9691_c0_g1_i1.p1  ORF type:complete len:852 (+),score=192.55 TRINITY_DN9691_c0_g1_i1:206-2557(+)
MAQEFRFEIVTPDRTYLIEAKGTLEREDWVNAINASVKYFVANPLSAPVASPAAVKQKVALDSRQRQLSAAQRLPEYAGHQRLKEALAEIPAEAPPVEPEDIKVVVGPAGYTPLSLVDYSTFSPKHADPLQTIDATASFQLPDGKLVITTHPSDELKNQSIRWRDELQQRAESALTAAVGEREPCFITSSAAVEKKVDLNSDPALWTCWLVSARTKTKEVACAVAVRNHTPPCGATCQMLTFVILGADNKFPGTIASTLADIVSNTYPLHVNYERSAIVSMVHGLACDAETFGWAKLRFGIVPPVEQIGIAMYNQMVIMLQRCGLNKLQKLDANLGQYAKLTVAELTQALDDHESCAAVSAEEFDAWRMGTKRFAWWCLDGGFGPMCAIEIAAARRQARTAPDVRSSIDKLLDWIMDVRAYDQPFEQHSLEQNAGSQTLMRKVAVYERCVARLFRVRYLRDRLLENKAQLYYNFLMGLVSSGQAGTGLISYVGEEIAQVALMPDHRKKLQEMKLIDVVYKLLLEQVADEKDDAVLATLLQALTVLVVDAPNLKDRLISLNPVSRLQEFFRPYRQTVVIEAACNLLSNLVSAAADAQPISTAMPQIQTVIPPLVQLLNPHSVTAARPSAVVVAAAAGVLWKLCTDKAIRKSLRTEANCLSFLASTFIQSKEDTVSGATAGAMMAIAAGDITAVRQLAKLGIVPALCRVISTSWNSNTVRASMALAVNIAQDYELSRELREAQLEASWAHVGQLLSQPHGDHLVQMLSVLQRILTVRPRQATTTR